MNVIRIKIVVFWLLFLGLVFLLYDSWAHRILWLLLFLATGAMTGFIGPKVRYPKLIGRSLFVIVAPVYD